jgi:DNA-directed RNA polymerase subunit RPC12/RpoP
MADLIDRKAAMDAFMGKPPEYYHTSYIVGEINSLPSVDAEPVRRGKWLTCDDRWGDVHYQCSECGQEWCLNDGTPEENGMNYCPHCGAKMEVGG